MTGPTIEVMVEAVALIDELRSGHLSDEDLSDRTERLDALLPDPHWYDYTIDRMPELPAEDVVRRAFEYRPIRL